MIYKRIQPTQGPVFRGLAAHPSAEAAPIAQQLPQALAAQAALPAQVEPAPTAEAEVEVEDSTNLHDVESPMVGTFYRSPAPEADAYVEVGDIVKPGTVLCIVEAMKLMNEIKADVAGRVAKVMVDNAQPVEFGQPLFRLDQA